MNGLAERRVTPLPGWSLEERSSPGGPQWRLADDEGEAVLLSGDGEARLCRDGPFERVLVARASAHHCAIEVEPPSALVASGRLGELHWCVLGRRWGTVRLVYEESVEWEVEVSLPPAPGEGPQAPGRSRERRGILGRLRERGRR